MADRCRCKRDATADARAWTPGGHLLQTERHKVAPGGLRASAGSRRGNQCAHLALRLAQVVLVLEHQGERLTRRRRVELAHAERTEPARPVERLGDRRRLLQIEPAE